MPHGVAQALSRSTRENVMIRKFMILAACLAVAACGDPVGIGSAGTTIPTPASVAQHTTADEQAMLRAEQAYRLTRTIGEGLVDTKFAKGGNLVKLRDLDNRLYAALTTARSAYRAFNSSSLLAAVDNVSKLADQVNALAGGPK
jgi:hypothetical protein